MEKKYFFFDIDGTLTDRSTGKIVPSAREALDLFRSKWTFCCDRNLEEHITKHVNSQKLMGLKIWSVVEAMAV